MWIIFKVFIEFVTILLLFYVLATRHHVILVPQPGIEPAHPRLEGIVLTTGPPGKFPYLVLFFFNCSIIFCVCDNS